MSKVQVFKSDLNVIWESEGVYREKMIDLFAKNKATCINKDQVKQSQETPLGTLTIYDGF